MVAESNDEIALFSVWTMSLKPEAMREKSRLFKITWNDWFRCCTEGYFSWAFIDFSSLKLNCHILWKSSKTYCKVRRFMNWFSSQSPTYETDTELVKYPLLYITSKNHFWHFWNVKWWCDASDLVVVYWFTCGLHENFSAKTDTAGCSALLKHIGDFIFMASVPAGIHLGSLLGSHRPLIIEQELAHHSATGVYSIHTYPHLLNYSASLIPALEGSQTQLHQLAGMSHQPDLPQNCLRPAF